MTPHFASVPEWPIRTTPTIAVSPTTTASTAATTANTFRGLVR